jgi:signal peptidase I
VKGLLKWLLWIVVLLAVAYVVGRLYVFDAAVATDNSMAPNIIRGDKFLVLVRGRINRGAPVVCDHPEIPGQKVIGRVVGFEGDSVQIQRQNLLLNQRQVKGTSEGDFVFVDDTVAGAPLTQELQLVREELGMIDYVTAWPKRGKVRDTRPYVASDGQYFLLADNRLTGADSRAYGPVSAESCKGRAFLIYRPGPSAGDASQTRRWFKFIH